MSQGPFEALVKAAQRVVAGDSDVTLDELAAALEALPLEEPAEPRIVKGSRVRHRKSRQLATVKRLRAVVRVDGIEPLFEWNQDNLEVVHGEGQDRTRLRGEVRDAGLHGDAGELHGSASSGTETFSERGLDDSTRTRVDLSEVHGSRLARRSMMPEKIREAFAACRAFLPEELHALRHSTDEREHLIFMCLEGATYADGRREKAMRWLGFVQGALWTRGLVSIDDLKKMNKPTAFMRAPEKETDAQRGAARSAVTKPEGSSLQEATRRASNAPRGEGGPGGRSEEATVPRVAVMGERASEAMPETSIAKLVRASNRVLEEAAPRNVLGPSPLLDAIYFLAEALRGVEKPRTNEAIPPGSMSAAWPSRDIVQRLADFANERLTAYDYDGHGWEELQRCRDEAYRWLAVQLETGPSLDKDPGLDAFQRRHAMCSQGRSARDPNMWKVGAHDMNCTHTAEDTYTVKSNPRPSEALHYPGHRPDCGCVHCEDMRSRTNEAEPETFLSPDGRRHPKSCGVWGKCTCGASEPRPDKATPRARLDADRTAKPLTEIAAVYPNNGQCIGFPHQVVEYVARPTEHRSDKANVSPASSPLWALNRLKAWAEGAEPDEDGFAVIDADYAIVETALRAQNEPWVSGFSEATFVAGLDAALRTPDKVPDLMAWIDRQTARRVANVVPLWKCSNGACGWVDASTCFERRAGDPCPLCRSAISEHPALANKNNVRVLERWLIGALRTLVAAYDLQASETASSEGT